MDISNSLAGLSLLTGTNAFATYAPSATATSATVESNAQRKSQALFTTPVTGTPWRTAANGTSVDAGTPPSASDVLALSSIVDAPASGSNALPDDVQTDFTAYKALDRLKVLAQAAAGTTISTTQRATLQAAFAQGLGDLQTFLAAAPGDQLTLAFNQPGSQGKTIAIPTSAAAGPKIVGQAVGSDRYAPLAGLSGNERFALTIAEGSQTDTLTIDLAQSAQPPTLDSVAGAINAAIATVPLHNADGSIATDTDGNAVQRWNVSALPTKTSAGWGLTITRTGNEQISIDRPGASDSLIVAANVTTPYAATAAQVISFDDPTGAMIEQTRGQIAAIDPSASAMAAQVAAGGPSRSTAAVAGTTITAPTSANAIAVDAQGFSYVVGTTNGDLGSHLGSGADGLFLSKRDSEGDVVWQRGLGTTASAAGAAVSIAPDGGVVVAGTVTGTFDGTNADGDMLVAKYSANGDEQFANLVRSPGADTATSVAVGENGTIYVGGQTAVGGGSAFVARLDASGHVRQRQTIAAGSAFVGALAVDPNGRLLVLTQQGADAALYRLDGGDLSSTLGTIDLGAASGRALAVAADGTIAVGGATLAPLAGGQVNGPASGRDGFVTRVTADLESASTTYVGSSGDDQVDSVAFMGGEIYAGGTTTGLLGAVKAGTTDGFVGRIGEASGQIENISQFGVAGSRTGAVDVAGAPGGNSALGAIGLHRGTLTTAPSDKLVTSTSIRAGDSFAIAINGGSPLEFTIGANDTLATLSRRLALLTGGKAIVTTPTTGASQSITITAKAGASIELIAGPPGQDALAKLGLSPRTLSLPPVAPAGAPPVTPGGRYGLDLTTTLSIGTAQDASASLARISQAISMSQTAYRSLYWDSGKAALANGGAGMSSSDSAAVARAQSQTAQYQAALNRLVGSTTTTSSSSTDATDATVASNAAWTSILSSMYAGPIT